MNYLIKLYHSSQVDYPRVFNGYSTVASSHFPHKEMAIVSPLLEPLRESSYPLTADTSKLFLSNNGLNEFSRLQAIDKYLIQNFTYELKPKKGKEKKIDVLQENLINFLNDENVLVDSDSYYRDSCYKKEDLFGINFISNKSSLYEQNKGRLRVSSDINQMENIDVQFFSTIDNAVVAYKEALNKTQIKNTTIRIKS